MDQLIWLVFEEAKIEILSLIQFVFWFSIYFLIFYFEICFKIAGSASGSKHQLILIKCEKNTIFFEG